MQYSGEIQTLVKDVTMPYLFERNSEGEVTVTFGKGELAETFHLVVPDPTKKSNIARMEVPIQFCNSAEKTQIIAQALFKATYMNGYYNRDGFERTKTDRPNPSNTVRDIVERSRPTEALQQFSFKAAIGRTFSTDKNPDDMRPAKSFWANRVNSAPAARVA